MLKNFKLQGNVSGAIRSDDDMESIDKAVADNSFKEQKRKSYGGRLSDIQQAWLDIIDREEDYSEIISSNIVTFKLPKKM